MAAQILHADELLSDLTYFPLPRAPDSSEDSESRLDLEKKDAYTQYTGGDNAMNVNYTAVIWRYDSI